MRVPIYADLELRLSPQPPTEQEVNRALDLLCQAVDFNVETGLSRTSERNEASKQVAIPDHIKRAELFKVTSAHFYVLESILQRKLLKTAVQEIDWHGKLTAAQTAVENVEQTNANEPLPKIFGGTDKHVARERRKLVIVQDAWARCGIPDKLKRRQIGNARLRAIKYDWQQRTARR